MKGKRHTSEQIIAKLREADTLLATVATIGHTLPAREASDGGVQMTNCLRSKPHIPNEQHYSCSARSYRCSVGSSTGRSERKLPTLETG